MSTAEFSRFAGILSAALSLHHLLGSEAGVEICVPALKTGSAMLIPSVLVE